MDPSFLHADSEDCGQIIIIIIIIIIICSFVLDTDYVQVPVVVIQGVQLVEGRFV